MNTYFVFWEKHETNGKSSNLEGRSLQAREVSACNGELNFWREVGSMAKENLVFSVPLANLVDFHIVRPLEIIKPKEGGPPKIDCEFISWVKSDEDLSQKIALLVLEIENVKRQKALDEREKSITFALWEANEERLNDEARKRKHKKGGGVEK